MVVVGKIVTNSLDWMSALQRRDEEHTNAHTHKESECMRERNSKIEKVQSLNGEWKKNCGDWTKIKPHGR